ncbi:MAG: purine-nucleoside/S-methyl-5-thioadenosine phosphorylase / adenosine deaminase [Bacteroidales bacterium]|nr:purine-nucleoside/S-methyl-5-thioadenosine phosphorylase / adenosine deaminase [Bacteroidales bacterium]
MQISERIQLLQFEKLLEFKDIIHFSTTRTGGFSKNHLAGFNLGYTVGDESKNVTQNLNLLARVLDIDKKQMVSPKQTHSKNIGVVTSTTEIFPNTDALITNIPGICIFVRTADCVPILLFDPVKKGIAAIHSGWKGTLQEISKHCIGRMQKEYGTQPKDLIAGIGPSIGPEVYEIGPEVIELFVNHFTLNNYITPLKNSDKGLLNLWEINHQILIDSGVPKEQIEVAGMCTYSNPELFYSARRDGVKCGRLATGIMLKDKK